jgi:cytochrome c oxidase cbb3-type subunit III
MRLFRLAVTALAVGLIPCGVVLAQDDPPGGGRGGRGQAPVVVKNPLEGNADAIRTGTDTYRARCTSCHGADAKGTAQASDLTGLWAAGGTDGQIFQSIRRGVPNTLMPHSFGPDNDMWPVLAYLRTLNVEPGSARPAGNAESGARVFATSCSSCHEVNGRGGKLGPDLSRVGASRSRPLLAHKIRHASAYIFAEYVNGYVNDGFQPVTLVTRDGRRIRGIKKNESAFDLQIMDTNEHIRGYAKADLSEVTTDTVSLMPDFGPARLNDRDLDDLLAYVGTLRGPTRSLADR